MVNLVDRLLDRLAHDAGAQINRLENAAENLAEALQIPVLVDDGVDDSREEHLVRLLSKKVNQVVHLVDGGLVAAVLLAPLRQDLLAEQEDEVAQVSVGCEILVLACILETGLDLVEQGSTNGRDEHIGHFVDGDRL